ncbi:hypothetical protein EGW08_001461 [Elysia chlorotica]|uniref:Uncharacterized protein n=1 Tax=Elysia chlorotica TaxID=188477 RepID=A0A433UAB2_ELYCH|nr:hypothetical protein EGW08_001461 [Elysia chlorotica]
MLELVSMLRPLTTWQMLLGVCLLDLALIAVRLSWPSGTVPALPSHQQHRLQHLQELLAWHARLAQEVELSRGQLEENRRRVQELLAAQAVRADTEEEQLRLLAYGVEDLEKGLATLMGRRARGATGTISQWNETRSGRIT